MSTVFGSGISFLILLLVVIGAGFTLFYKIRGTVRSITNEAFGTTNLSEARRMMDEQSQTTPKSVSAQTSLLLPQIQRDFPSFSLEENKARVEAVILSYLTACNSGNASSFTDGSAELKEYLTSHINLIKENHLDEHFENIKFHRTEIRDYRKTGGYCHITFQSALQMRYYVKDSNGKVTKGSDTATYQTRYNVTLSYVQDRTIVEQSTDTGKGLICPNCAAPITNLGQKKCEYCGTTLVAFNIKIWEITGIAEA